MKYFRLCNHDWENWYEHTFVNACDVAYEIKRNGFTTFEIEWRTPINGYVTLIKYDNGVRTYLNDNFKIPKTLLKL